MCYRLLTGFLDAQTADGLLATLQSTARWRAESLFLFGRRVAVPRRVCWYGDAGLNYRYSGTDHRCDGWLDALVPLRDRLADEHGFTGNMVLLNRYRDGNDSMGWHRDDEAGLSPQIASVSLGATRRLLVRPATSGRSIPLDLPHGSLLLMNGSLSHSVPRTRRSVDERINLTFRRLAG